MNGQHLVRVGAMGTIGRFRAEDAVCYPRDMRVIVRTARGLETGEVLAPPTGVAIEADPHGVILRGMTTQDHLLEARLQKRRRAALQACSEQLSERRIDATLIDVEQLFDGRSLLFYFLGVVPPEVEQLTNELAQVYDAEAGLEDFAQLVESGCGPDCGTEGAAGCGSCGTGCALAGACGAAQPTP